MICCLSYFIVVVIVLYCYVVRCYCVFVLLLYYINGMCVLYPNYCMSMCVVFYICTYISSSREERHLPNTWSVNQIKIKSNQNQQVTIVAYS